MPGKKTKRIGKSAGQLSTLNEHAAGLDVGSTFHVVAVRGDQDKEPVRTFRSFSGDLHKMADWLGGIGITTVAMESTGVYWIPVFEILEARGFEVLLVNARDVKNVPGRKTDVNDAQWLQQLHQHGLLRGSFRPRDEVVYARLLDENRYLCSERTMYRILAANAEVRERRDQLRHPAYKKPELLATAPNQVWSWDITKLLGPAK
jgi:hypothetical protein